MVLNCNRLQKLARDRLLYAIDGVLTNFSSIGHVLEGCLEIGPFGQMRTGAHIRARGRFFFGQNHKFRFCALYEVKIFHIPEYPPKTGGCGFSFDI